MLKLRGFQDTFLRAFSSPAVRSNNQGGGLFIDGHAYHGPKGHGPGYCDLFPAIARPEYEVALRNHTHAGAGALPFYQRILRGSWWRRIESWFRQKPSQPSLFRHLLCNAGIKTVQTHSLFYLNNVLAASLANRAFSAERMLAFRFHGPTFGVLRENGKKPRSVIT